MSYQPVSQDYEQLRRDLAGVMKSHAARSEPEPGAIFPGSARWIEHLAWLKSRLSAGTLDISQLLAHEAEGLRIMDEVSRELGKKLHRCPRCGAFTESMLACSSCGQSFN